MGAERGPSREAMDAAASIRPRMTGQFRYIFAEGFDAGREAAMARVIAIIEGLRQRELDRVPDERIGDGSVDTCTVLYEMVVGVVAAHDRG